MVAYNSLILSSTVITFDRLFGRSRTTCLQAVCFICIKLNKHDGENMVRQIGARSGTNELSRAVC